MAATSWTAGRWTRYGLKMPATAWCKMGRRVWEVRRPSLWDEDEHGRRITTPRTGATNGSAGSWNEIIENHPDWETGTNPAGNSQSKTASSDLIGNR